MVATRPNFVPLQGWAISLEPMTSEHFADLFAAIAHPVVFEQGFGGGLANLTTDIATFSEWASLHFKFDTSHVYIIRATTGPLTGAILGTTTLGDFDDEREHTHIFSTAFAPHAWGTTVNAMTKYLLLERAFTHGYGRVRIQADVMNHRSRRAIEALGAQFEGVVRRDKQRADGSWRDTALYSILIDEWPMVAERLEQRIATKATSHPLGVIATSLG
jgi:RimJ/RimL family protein N-acetyltransferase